MTARAAIDVQHLTKRFGDFVAVDDITLSVSEGEIFGLLGPNGCGKTTLIRLLTTLLTPTAGTAVVAGFDVVRDPVRVRRAIGVIPQQMTSDRELSVYENLLIHAKLYGVPAARRTPLITYLLDAVDLTAWANKQVKFLSGGMRRRVEIARGLVHQPRVLFLDEPTTGLDPVSRAAVWEMLRAIKAKQNLTVMLTTHYLDEADQLCDRVAIVDHGRLIALDTPLALKAAIPGKSVIEASFAAPPEAWADRLRTLRGAEEVSQSGAAFRIASSDGPQTTKALIDAAEDAHTTLKSLAVQSTTLDDVFARYTGRQLRDTLAEPPASERLAMKGRR